MNTTAVNTYINNVNTMTDVQLQDECQRVGIKMTFPCAGPDEPTTLNAAQMRSILITMHYLHANG
jgi:hypothetical protein